MTSPDGTAQGKTRVFISYSRRDRAFVSKVVEALEAAADIEVFRDTDDILPTEEWKERLEQLIAESDTVVFALSPHSARSEVCSWEVDHALSLNKRVAPVVIRDVDPGDVPASLSRYNYIFFTNRREFDASIDNLIAALNTDIGWIREHTRLGEAARRWARQGGGRSQLLRGDDLAHAETWIAQQPANAPLPSGEHRTFIASSRAAETRRQRSWFIGSIAAAVIMAVVAVFAFQQRDAAVRNERLAGEERDRAEQERNRAVAAETLAEQRAQSEAQAKERAERALRAATETASDMITKIAVEFRDSGVPVATVGNILEVARGLLHTLAEQGLERPELRGALARAYDEISATLGRQGDAEAARTAAAQSIEIARGLVAQEPDEDRWQTRLSSGLIRLADALFYLGEFDAASAAVSEATAIARAALERDADNASLYLDLQMLLQRSVASAVSANQNERGLEILIEAEEIGRRAVELQPDDPKYVAALAATLSMVGVMHERDSDIAAAIGPYEEALELIAALSLDDPINTVWRYQKATTLYSLASAYLATGQADHARPHLAEAIADLTQLTRADPDDEAVRIALGNAYAGLADVDSQEGDNEAARQNLLAALQIYRDTAEANPENIVVLAGLAQRHASLAALYLATDHVAEAVEAYRVRLDLLERILRDTPQSDLTYEDLAKAHDQLGDAYVAAGDHAGAEREFEAALAVRTTLADHAPSDTVRRYAVALLHAKAGDARAAQGNGAGALQHYRSALEVTERLLESDADNTVLIGNRAFVSTKLAAMLRLLGRPDDAVAALRVAVEIYSDLAGGKPEDTVDRVNLYVTLLDLAGAEEDTGDADAAIAAYEEALVVQESLVRDDPRNAAWLGDLAYTHSMLAGHRAERDETDAVIGHMAAVADVHEVLTTLEPDSDDHRSALMNALFSLAALRERTGDQQGAADVYVRITEIADRASFEGFEADGFDENLALAHFQAGRGLAAVDRLDEALRHFQRADDAYAALRSGDADDAVRALQQVTCLAEIVTVHLRLEDADAAHETLDRLVGLAEPLVDAGTAMRDLWSDYVWALRVKGWIYRNTQAPEEAVAWYGRAVALQAGKLEDEPQNDALASALNEDLVVLARIRLTLGDVENARLGFERSAALLTVRLQRRPDDDDVARKLAETSLELGDTQVKAGNVPAALDAYRVSLAMRQRLLEGQPDDPSHRMEVAFVYWRLADVGEDPVANWRIVVAMMAELDEAGQLHADLQPWLAAARENLEAAMTATE